MDHGESEVSLIRARTDSQANNSRKWLSSQNHKAANKAGASRDELFKQAQDSYASASKSGGSNYASATSYLASATEAAKETTFDTWSDSELKLYLDSYGVKTYQGSTVNELKAMARKNANYFRYGTTTPQGTFFGRLQSSFYSGTQWVSDWLKIGQKEASSRAEKVGDDINEAAATATDRLRKGVQKGSDKVKEEL